MYLMNVPPVAATHTEWRKCGPGGGYSLPIGFNDSDTDLSTRGTPISDKVQMIIESLRSSQSSLEMGDEIVGNVLSGQEGRPQACKVAVGSYAGAKSKTEAPAENQQADVSSHIDRDSSDSDSDDSVDRGIEEAILEYLKEKDDHKRKAEPCFTFLPSSKIARKNPPLPQVSKQNADSNTFLTPSSQFPRSVKAETLTAPDVVPVKKHIKNKDSSNDDAAKKLDTNKSTTARSLVSSKEQAAAAASPVKTVNLFEKLKVKVEEDSSDSSSDDGIEEAIQRYQLEKKEQQNKRESFDPHAFGGEESDSTSDDGIEEAIRCYQLEQRKEKESVFKPLFHRQNPFSESLIRSVGSSAAKQHKLRKKKKPQPSPSSAFIPKNPPSDGAKGKGNGVLLFKVESFKEQPAPSLAAPKVNTTAELMCAEAILDISKTVMPGAFHPPGGLSSCAPAQSSSKASPAGDGPAEESDGSSIDSEDGIELEIRKFLEQKAQMHKKPPGSALTEEPQSVNEPEEVEIKQVSPQMKLSRLSTTQKRKFKAENCSISDLAEADDKESRTKPAAGSHKTEQSGEKSSSLDSDEDLDTAIKDLLKTKKKLKKKTRDLQRKSRKRPKDEEPVIGNALPAKTFKSDPISKRGALKKVKKSKDDAKDKLSKVPPHKEANESEAGREAPQLKDDSSSVDSDDSIEQEIRRFLAEKAKVSTAEKSKDGDAPRNGTAAACSSPPGGDVIRENQLAEIPRSTRSPDVADVSRLPAVQSCSPAPLEPADGAGAARAEQRRPGAGRGHAHDLTAQADGKVRPASGANSVHSRLEAIKWRQSLGLPTPDSRTHNRNPFHITSSKVSEPALRGGTATPRPQTPVTVWSSAKTSRAPFSCSSETSFRAPLLNPFSPARQHPRVSFTQSLAGSGHRSQGPAEGEAQSMVHMAKDKSVFVELESNRTNHVQVRSRERSEGKDRGRAMGEIKREGECGKIDDKDVHLERAEEEFIDEAECESGSRRSPEKKQGLSTLSLSRSIDPGFTFRPCIALSTEERSAMFNRRHQAIKSTKSSTSVRGVPVRNKSVQRVKRRLQFVPVNRTIRSSNHRNATE